MLEEEIVKKLLEKQYTVTTAESCTGGLLAGRILNVPGASSVYNEGHITYSNEAKERLLGVSHETLVRYGAVSRQTAEEMARGAAKTAKAEIGLSTTGIAGPGGGTKEKPVGGCGSGAEIVGGKFIVIFNKENVFTEKQCFIMSNYKKYEKKYRRKEKFVRK